MDIQDFFIDQKEMNISNQVPELVSFRELVPEIKSTSYLTHSIYYYPAKFIPQVVKYCIDEYTQKNDWIIDPFAGSGTVGLEANIHQRNAVLTDLNYLLNHIIPIKIVENKDFLDYNILEQKLRIVLESNTKFLPNWSNIEYWYPVEMLEILQNYWGGQKSLENDLYAKIIQSVLVKASKLFSYAEHKTPKLFKSKSKAIYVKELLEKNWQNELINFVKKMCNDTLKSINEYIEKTKKTENKVIYYGGVDSSTFQFQEDIQIDCLISSPPYLQAQEYIRTVKLDLYWLGYTEQEVQSISRLEIPYRKSTKLIETPTLNQVRNELKVDKLHNILNSYFCHTINALENATQKLKIGGKACIFVGNPKVDGIEVETWKILEEYFLDKNFILNHIFEDKIKSRQLFKARNNKNPDGMKSEYLLVLEKK